MKSLLIYVALTLPAFAIASIPNSKIQATIENKLNKLSNKEAWEKFVTENPKLFPVVSSENAKTTVVVAREEEKIEGETYVLGVGYRQTFIRSPIERVQKILNTPELFQALYGLDAEADVEKVKLSEKELLNRQKFKARVFKKVSLIPNQDYILEYTNQKDGEMWFQRAKLSEDKENFALRDNLKSLSTKDDGVVFREISIVYGLKWYVRFFGPTVREVMNKELAKITDSTKCLAEKTVDITPLEAKICWDKNSK